MAEKPCPPIVGVQERELPVLLDWAVKVTVPLPVPLLDDAPNHEHKPETLQAQPLPAVTFTVVLPPPAGAVQLVGEIVTVQHGPCVTVKLCPPIVGVQERELPVLLDWAVKVTVPLPVPLLDDAPNHEHKPETLQAQPLPAVTFTVVLPPQAGAVQLVGEIVTVQHGPCVTVKLCPPIVGVQERELPVLLDWAVKVTVPLPVPLLDDAPNHEHKPETLQLQQLADAVTLTVVLPPQAGAVQLAGEIVRVHGTAACSTVQVCPAMVKVQLRLAHVSFALAETVIEPLPVPLAGETVSQLQTPVTRQVQQLEDAFTVMLVLPPPAGSVQLVCERENVQQVL